MKSIVKIFFSAFAFVVFGCSPKGDGSVSMVDVNGYKMTVMSLDNLKSGITTLPLSNLIEDCVLVQLETKDDAFFRPQYTTVTEKYIGIREQNRKPYKLFDRSGKFLCDVGSVGQGPGEYAMSIYDDLIDDKNNLIYLAIFMGNKILVYNTSGKFTKEIVSPFRLNKPKLFLSDNILTVLHMPIREEKVMVIQFDVNTGNVLKELAAPEQFVVMDYENEIFNTRNIPQLLDFAPTCSDTLYHYDAKNNTVLPVFLMAYNADASQQPWKNNIQINRDLVITCISYLETIPETGRKGFVLKGTAATNLKTRTSSWVNVANDYFGHLPVSPSVITFRNGYFVHNIQPEQLMDDIEKRLAESSCSENDKQVLRKTRSTLKENTNNVVFIGKIKN